MILLLLVPFFCMKPFLKLIKRHVWQNCLIFSLSCQILQAVIQQLHQEEFVSGDAVFGVKHDLLIAQADFVEGQSVELLKFQQL